MSSVSFALSGVSVGVVNENKKGTFMNMIVGRWDKRLYTDSKEILATSRSFVRDGVCTVLMVFDGAFNTVFAIHRHESTVDVRATPRYYVAEVIICFNQNRVWCTSLASTKALAFSSTLCC
jgi:hypothetical protein